ncbi:16S rRNA (cytosine1402-N4)-methyltransferase [Actinopolyspora mzabensis]|uniref:Ribosomal RNA small subunit methyltransferase H n=1 Tax=Actinopolyspora mzabensis TaxID=995066 RepID=A0A1G8YW67_ACTMZ|nr:16S rRNA (cytosine(1402)-N(4))-methyltransferase RsmH [Actinopolyspora mzabensis]SDK07068.1 16S rRNA (cytosine1402-N4)-methyltransferase [Actinopolyspora mzabensis]
MPDSPEPAAEPEREFAAGKPDPETAQQRHLPVLLERTVELFEPALRERRTTVLDATLGMGGHTEALLRAFPGVTVIGVDRDPEALRLARQRLADYGERVRLVHGVDDQLEEILTEQGVSELDGVLFDLGVSSLQLDESERGFSYARDAPLDMRMDTTTGRTAADVLNTASRAELIRILREYGEEKFAARIASEVVRAREVEPFGNSARFVRLIYDCVPAAARRTGGHPAKRTFQALRIEVNGELEVLRRALPQAVDALSGGGRIVVLSYHSLEDRAVKRVFAERAKSRTPVDLPVELPGHGPQLRLLTRGAEFADETEAANNPRASSVRLRAAERIEETP